MPAYVRLRVILERELREGECLVRLALSLEREGFEGLRVGMIGSLFQDLVCCFDGWE